MEPYTPEWYEKRLKILRASSNGETIQEKCNDGTWKDCILGPLFWLEEDLDHYCIKPKI